MAKTFDERVGDWSDRWSAERSGEYVLRLSEEREVAVYDCHSCRDMAGRVTELAINSDTGGAETVYCSIDEVEAVYDKVNRYTVLERPKSDFF